MSETKAISTRGRTFTGIVISDKMNKTVTVEWERRRYIPKYERYQKRRTKVKAHNPITINAEKGDLVSIMETRPISKTKNFIVIEIVKKHQEKAKTEDPKEKKEKKITKKAKSE
ncbi:MAG: 30S ribosomal protein S17 [Candidatus Nanoarchaeia archaeon]